MMSREQVSEAALARRVGGQVSDCITSGRAAWNFGRDSYDRLYFFIPNESRKLWGRLFALLLHGWDRAEDMLAARELLGSLIDELLGVGERITADKIGLVNIAAGLAIVGIFGRAIGRRVAELSEAQAAAAATEADESAGGGKAA